MRTYYITLLFYCYIHSTVSLSTSSASKHDIPVHATITLKEHLRHVGQQLKKLPITKCACHASLKNYSDAIFETRLEEFKKKCIRHSIDQENKRIIIQELERAKNILESLYTCFITEDIQPNNYICLTYQNTTVAKCHYRGLHNFAESAQAFDYYNNIVQMLNLYSYFPAAQVTTCIYTKIASLEENAASVISTHLMEHIHHNMSYFFTLLSCLSRQQYYFNDTIICKLAQLLQEYKRLAFFCYTLEKATLSDLNSAATSSIHIKPE